MCNQKEDVKDYKKLYENLSRRLSALWSYIYNAPLGTYRERERILKRIAYGQPTQYDIPKLKES